MFWLACEELKKETNKTVVEEKVRQIYEDFISILSPKEVSRRDIKGAVRTMSDLIPRSWNVGRRQSHDLLRQNSGGRELYC